MIERTYFFSYKAYHPNNSSRQVEGHIIADSKSWWPKNPIGVLEDCRKIVLKEVAQIFNTKEECQITVVSFNRI